MEAAVDTALQEFRDNLLTKLQAVFELELAARTASLEERERKLEVFCTGLVGQAQQALANEQKEAAPQMPAAGPSLFVRGSSPTSLKKNLMHISEPQTGLATRPSSFKPGQALQHRNKADASTKPTPTRAGGDTGLAQQARPTYQLPLEPLAGQLHSLPPGCMDTSPISKLAASVRRDLSPTVSRSYFRVPSPLATPKGAQTHRVEQVHSAPYQLSSPLATPKGAQTHRVERIHSSSYQLPPSLAAPSTFQQWASYQDTPAVIPLTPAQTPHGTPCRSPCQTPRTMIQTPVRRTASAPARVQQSEWNFLVPKGSMGPNRVEFDGGRMFRDLDSNRDGSISPEKVAEYITGQRRTSMAQPARPLVHSPNRLASPGSSLNCAASPALTQSTSDTNLVGATPVSDFRQSPTDRSYTPSPVPSKARIMPDAKVSRGSTIAGWSQRGGGRERSRLNEGC